MSKGRMPQRKRLLAMRAWTVPANSSMGIYRANPRGDDMSKALSEFVAADFTDTERAMRDLLATMPHVAERLEVFLANTVEQLREGASEATLAKLDRFKSIQPAAVAMVVGHGKA